MEEKVPLPSSFSAVVLALWRVYEEVLALLAPCSPFDFSAHFRAVCLSREE